MYRYVVYRYRDVYVKRLPCFKVTHYYHVVQLTWKGRGAMLAAVGDEIPATGAGDCRLGALAARAAEMAPAGAR